MFRFEMCSDDTLLANLMYGEGDRIGTYSHHDLLSEAVKRGLTVPERHMKPREERPNGKGRPEGRPT